PVQAPVPPPESRPVRISPGLRAPRTSPAAVKPAIPTLQPIDSDESPPALVGPAEMRAAEPIAPPRFSTEAPGAQPNVLESVPTGEANMPPAVRSRPGSGPKRARA